MVISRPYDLRNPYLAPVVASRELFQKGCLRSCLHLELDISNTRLKWTRVSLRSFTAWLSSIRYEAGDHVAVYPSNDEVLVNRVGELLNADLDEVFSLINVDGLCQDESSERELFCWFFLEDAQKKNPFPCPCSYRTALSYYLDLTSHPNTQVLKEIAQYATDEDEKALLTLMGSYSEEGKVRSSMICS